MKTKLLKNLRNQAFKNFYFTCSKWSRKWITKIDNIEYQTSWGDSDILYRLQDNGKVFLRECIIRAVKARRGEKVDSIVVLYDLIKK